MAVHTFTFGSVSPTNAATGFTDSSLSITDLTSQAAGTFTPFSSSTFTPGTDPASTVRIRLAVAGAGTSTGTFTIFQSAGGTVYVDPGTTGTTTLVSGSVTYSITAGSASNISIYVSAADFLSVLQSVTFTDTTGGAAGSLTDSVGVALSYYTGSAGTYTAQTKATASQAVTFVACYLRGTMILTTSGERAVETLQIGDTLVSADGHIVPVKWIGFRFYEAEDAQIAPSVRPVLFQAGSLGENTPIRDLRVSAMHGMLVDNVIVPAAALINGTTITRDAGGDAVHYFHVETENHDLIVADGAAAETFIDNNSRVMFENAAEFTALYGDGATTNLSIAPRVEEGYLLDAIQRRLGAVAPADRSVLRGCVERITDGVLEGWAFDGTGSVELDVLVDGEIVTRVIANRFRTDLDDAGFANGRAGFTVALPASATTLRQVEIRRAADGAILPHLEMAAAD